MTNLALEQIQDSSPVGRLTTAADCHQFALAGNATLTIRSARTGARFTYRIRKSQDGATYFVALLNGPDNGSSYAYIGYLKRGVYYHGGKKSRVGYDAGSNVAFTWFWRAIFQNRMPELLQVWHEGRCGRCNRRLTVPSSIANGIGPECAERMGTAQMICETLGEDQ